LSLSAPGGAVMENESVATRRTHTENNLGSLRILDMYMACGATPEELGVTAWTLTSHPAGETTVVALCMEGLRRSPCGMRFSS
jgi:hypothetical protein